MWTNISVFHEQSPITLEPQGGNLLSLVTANLSCPLTFEKNVLFFCKTKFIILQQQK